MAASVYVGTSGWAYKAWATGFYPAGVGPARQLAYYVTRFPTVELNATFYRLPSEAALANWRAQAPQGFLYAVKGSRTVTHYFKLQPGAKSFDLLLGRLPGLGPSLGPLLWQLPPGFRKDSARLADFLAALPRGMRHALEFRDASWLDDEIFGLLSRHRCAHVSLSAAWLPRDLTVTTDFAYVRLHGLAGGAAHDYTRRELAPWAAHLDACARAGQRCYVYFNNDVGTHAPHNALALMELLGELAVRPTTVWSEAPVRRRRRPARG